MDFNEHLIDTFGPERAQKIMSALQEEPTAAFRLNPKKCSNNNYIKSFTNDFSPYNLVTNAFYTNMKLGNHPLHHAGAFYLQDASAMLVGQLLPIQPTDKVIDLCAAPGGKATQVAPLLTKGFLIANDINYPRAKVLSQNVERLGLTNVFVTNNSIIDFESNYQGYFDKVILDAPCSGEGMFRKNELAKEDWSYEKVKRCAELQKELIIQAYSLLKKDGLLIYSTCTFSKEENEDVIKWLLSQTKATLVTLPKLPQTDRGLEMPEALRLLPDTFKGEGHFIALIKCNDEHPCSHFSGKTQRLDKQALKLFHEFATEHLIINIDENLLINKDGNLYLLPAQGDSNTLKTLRGGLLLGEIKDDRFVPAHALAMACDASMFRPVLDIAEESTILKYLHGETLKTDLPNGYALVTYQGISLGLGKVSNGILKNLYPKGLRL